MSWARRPREETPEMEQRELQDEQGRRWIGSVRSSSSERGEAETEVIFVCEDQPSETKRVARLDVPAAEADERWRAMEDRDILKAFHRAEPL